MDASLAERFLWVAVPFAVAAWLFRKREQKKKDKEFNPIKTAAACGGVVGGLFFLLFAAPFLQDSIWNIRRIWWSSFGPFPSLKTVVPLAMSLGLVFTRVRGGVFEKMRFAALVPLVAWLMISPPHNRLVEMNRFREPGWRDGVCLQSTGFTCGPSAAATVLRVYGIESSESEMATRCKTTSRGSTMVGMARGLASKFPEGKFTVRVCHLTAGEIERIPLPCITCTYNHAWVVFGVNGDGTLDMGEGGGGRHIISWHTFNTTFTGETVVVLPNNRDRIPSSADNPSEAMRTVSYLSEVDGSGRTVVSFGSAPLETLIAESDDW